MHSSKAIIFFALSELFSAALAKCAWNVACPCGPSAIYYTFCLDDVPSTPDPCATWTNCETCRNDLNECLSCAKGTYGPTCQFNATDSRVFRQKRQFNNPYPRYPSGSNRVCRDLQSPISGSLSCWISASSRVCTATCLPGYVFEGRESETEIALSCDGGFWTPAASFPNCKSGGHCELEISDGEYNCTTTTAGTYCDVMCSSSFVYERYFCYPGSDWSPPLPYCITALGGETFPEFPELARPISTCSCLNGGTCDRDGTCVCPSNYAGPFCASPVVCRDPGNVVNAERFNIATGQSSGSQSYQVGDSVLYTCHSGYTRTGESLLTCLSTAQWSSQLPTCRVVSVPQVPTQRPRIPPPTRESAVFCADPGRDVNGERFMVAGSRDGVGQRGFAQGTELVYNCLDGYTLQGQESLSCLPTGRWSGVRPSCRLGVAPPLPGSQPQPSEADIPDEEFDEEDVLYCDSPRPISNGRWIVVSTDQRNPQSADDTEFRETTRLLVTCDEGFALVGSPTLLCQADGFWSHNTPTCTTNV